MIDNVLDNIFKVNETYEPYTIAKNHDISIVHSPLDVDTYGLTIRNNRCSTILLNSETHENIQEFVLCHEIGHCFLHKSASTPFMRNYGAPAQVSKIEAEANRFAFQLLKRNYGEMEYMTKEQIITYFNLENYMMNYIWVLHLNNTLV